MSEKVTVFEVLALISCGIIIGGVGMAFYYVPAYYDMQDQRDMYRTNSRDAITERNSLRSQVDPLNTELRRKTVDYEELRIKYNDLNTNHRSVKLSHDKLNNEYSSLVDEYNDQVVILNDVNALSRQQQQQLNSVSGLMQDSYNRGYNDASMGDDDGIGDLLELLILFI
ncbi:MAG: hypothetical protein KAR40_17715 [Candidatus Sabulitectum sp.]|nr:hypothetical protein [Candidatus Sabulitectum sp.]